MLPKAHNAIAVADDERGGEVRYLGEVDASAASMCRDAKDRKVLISRGFELCVRL